jgi:hypothetical protein
VIRLERVIKYLGLKTFLIKNSNDIPMSDFRGETVFLKYDEK